MSLQVWLPLNGNLNNLGLDGNLNIVNNGATVNALGKIGQCYSFNGNDQMIAINSPTVFNIFKGGTQQFSITFWVLHEDTRRAIIFGDWSLANSIGFNVELSGGHQVRFYWDGSPDWYPSINVGQNIWTHLAIVYNGTTLTVYKNGAITSGISWTGPLVARNKTAGEFRLGRDARTTDTALKGRLNDFRIYDHCLSTKEIEEISKGLILHYKLDDKYSESTINLCNGSTNGTQASAASPSSWGAHKYYTILVDKDVNDPIPNNKKSVMTIDYSTSYGSGGGASVYPPTSFTVEPSTTYIYSRYIKPSDDFVYTHANFLYRYEYASGGGTRLIEGGIFNKNNIEYIGNGWYRCWGTFTTQSTTAYLSLPFYTYPGKSITYELSGLQLEKKDHMTPYVEHERIGIVYDSSGYNHNGWLIDGKNILNTPRYNNAIYLQGTTVDSTSNTIIGVEYFYGSLPLPVSSALTVSWWGNNIKYGRGGIFETTDQIFTATNGFSGTDYNTTAIANWDSNFGIYNGSTRINIFSSFVQDSTWHYHTIVFDGTKVYYYCDSILKTSSTLTGTLPAFNGIRMGLGRAGGVYRQIEQKVSDLRIYVTALTQSQIKELYDTSAAIDKSGNIYAREVQEI